MTKITHPVMGVSNPDANREAVIGRYINAYNYHFFNGILRYLHPVIKNGVGWKDQYGPAEGLDEFPSDAHLTPKQRLSSSTDKAL